MEIWSGKNLAEGDLLFNGFSAGLQEQTPVTAGTSSVVTMKIVGPLSWISQFRDEIFTFVPSGTVTTSDTFSEILTDQGYTGDRVVHPSTTRVISKRLNQSGRLNQNKRRVRFSDAARLLSEIEFAQSYDERTGAIVFEAYGSVRREPLPTPIEIDPIDATLTNVKSGLPLDYVINEINGEGDSFVTRGEQGLDVVTPELPFTFTVPANADYIQRVQVSTSGGTEFVQSWKPLVAGTHYTATATTAPVLNEASLDAYITWPKSGTAYDVTLLKLEGEPFRKEAGRRLAVRSTEASSFRIYGTRSLNYPFELVSDTGLAGAQG